MRRRHGDSAPITRFVRASMAAHSRSARRPRARPRRPRRPHASIGSEARSRETGNSPCRRPPAPAAPRGIVGAPVPTYAALQWPIPTCPCGCARACECGCEYAVWACCAWCLLQVHSEYSRGTLSVVPSNLRAKSLQTDAHALVALTPAHICVRTSAYPHVHLFAPASARICAEGCGASLPATAPRLARRACACGSVSVCLCVCAHT
jgi:hypothetical protein